MYCIIEGKLSFCDESVQMMCLFLALCNLYSGERLVSLLSGGKQNGSVLGTPHIFVAASLLTAVFFQNFSRVIAVSRHTS